MFEASHAKFLSFEVLQVVIFEKTSPRLIIGASENRLLLEWMGSLCTY